MPLHVASFAAACLPCNCLRAAVHARDRAARSARAHAAGAAVRGELFVGVAVAVIVDAVAGGVGRGERRARRAVGLDAGRAARGCVVGQAIADAARRDRLILCIVDAVARVDAVGLAVVVRVGEVLRDRAAARAGRHLVGIGRAQVRAVRHAVGCRHRHRSCRSHTPPASCLSWSCGHASLQFAVPSSSSSALAAAHPHEPFGRTSGSAVDTRPCNPASHRRPTSALSETSHPQIPGPVLSGSGRAGIHVADAHIVHAHVAATRVGAAVAHAAIIVARRCHRCRRRSCPRPRRPHRAARPRSARRARRPDRSVHGVPVVGYAGVARAAGLTCATAAADGASFRARRPAAG